VAPLIVQQMARTIRALKAQGVSVLLSEQNLPFAQAVADRAYLIEQGQIAHHGSMAEVVASDEVRKNYLGL
jgi:branched-chain amino acid transport system ATP-binding protein